MRKERAEIVAALQSEIQRMEGFRPSGGTGVDMGLGEIREAFPEGGFPLGAIHEFLSASPVDMAATSGFMAGLLAPLMGLSGTSVWISASRTLFPPALKSFGVQPEHFIFIDLTKEKDVLWAMEEALKCGALSAVVGEVEEISFTDSRRLQLAVEQSSVTGFILRRHSERANTTACVSRWKIHTLPSATPDNLPGVGFPQWRVELLRMRNGRTGAWNLQWRDGSFRMISNAHPATRDISGDASAGLWKRKAG